MMPITAKSGGRTEGITLRRLERTADLEACVTLQRLVWGEEFGDLTPPALLKIVNEVAGVTAGAFDDASGRLDGFVFGISGLREGRPAHWSHMLAVRSQRRGMGLGLQLKAFQRQLLLESGIDTVFWTYDPLVARNAHLNLERLGARPDHYRRDYYGSGEDSSLSAGIGTDRFLVRWELSSDRTERALAGRPVLDLETLQRADRAPIVNLGDRPEEGDVAPLRPLDEGLDPWPEDEPMVRVEIPEDIQAVRDADPDRAAAWRRSSRLAIETCLAAGYRAEGFLRGPGSRCGYVFVRSEP